MNKYLELKNINKKYHTKNGEIEAIKNISLEVNKGDFVGIVGPSGCGKSTLLNIISGLESTKGYLTTNLSYAYMLQTDALFDHLTIYENAILGLKIQKKDTESNIEYVNNLLSKFGLKDFANKYPNNLSGGMRQRVALIRTLAIKPDIILLDEPLSALDYVTRITITDELYKIFKDLNITVILITHDIAECISFCDKVVVLSKRPAIVKNKYILKYESNIPSERRKEQIFNYYYDLVWGDLDKTIN